MRHRNGREDKTEGSPRANDVCSRLARPSNRHWRKTIKCESNIPADVPVKTTRHVPQRGAQQEPCERKGKRIQKR